MTQIPKLAFSISDASAACNIGRTTIYAAIRDGDLQVCKIGRRTVIMESALRQWLASSLRSNKEGGITQMSEGRSSSLKA